MWALFITKLFNLQMYHKYFLLVCYLLAKFSIIFKFLPLYNQLSIFSFSVFVFFSEGHNRLFYSMKDFCFGTIFCSGALIFYSLYSLFAYLNHLDCVCVVWRKNIIFSLFWLAKFSKLLINLSVIHWFELLPFLHYIFWLLLLMYIVNSTYFPYF